MNHVMLSHVVERDKYLNRKTLDQTQAETREVVHFNEVVEVDWEQLESDHKMLSEKELFVQLDDVLFVFGIMQIERLNQLGFNKALLI